MFSFHISSELYFLIIEQGSVAVLPKTLFHLKVVLDSMWVLFCICMWFQSIPVTMNVVVCSFEKSHCSALNNRNYSSHYKH